MLQQQFDFSPHQRENNNESQQFLNDNKDHFASNNEFVYHLLKSGMKLSVSQMVKEYDVASLPRRIADLELRGINIKREWVGKTVRYYL